MDASPNTTLHGQTVLITGASSGIGQSLARALAARGNRVVIAARQREALQALAAEDPEHLLPLVWDITDRQACDDVREELRRLAGTLDTAILNAGTCEYVDVHAFDPALFQRVFDVNLQGTVNSVATVLPLLQERGRGAYLVGVSSLSTYLPLPRAAAYGGSKAALRYLFDTLRVELAGAGIDVSVVSPGFVRTPLTARNDFDMPFLLEPEQACRALLKGLDRRRSEIRFPRRLAWPMAALRSLPTAWWTRLAQSMVRN